ncbi:MAG: hypothetical protein ACREBU_04175 [Nitrososphaera sp.]
MVSFNEYKQKTRNEIREIQQYRRSTNTNDFWQAKDDNALDFDLCGSGCCIICFEANPLVLEQHHIAGRQNSSATITLCANCHKILTTKQTSWHKSWSFKNNMDEMQFLFLFAGLNDMGSLFDNTESMAIIEFLLAFAIHKEKEQKALNVLLLFPLLFGIIFATIMKRRDIRNEQ